VRADGDYAHDARLPRPRHDLLDFFEQPLVRQMAMRVQEHTCFMTRRSGCGAEHRSLTPRTAAAAGAGGQTATPARVVRVAFFAGFGFQRSTIASSAGGAM